MESRATAKDTMEKGNGKGSQNSSFTDFVKIRCVKSKQQHKQVKTRKMLLVKKACNNANIETVS